MDLDEYFNQHSTDSGTGVVGPDYKSGFVALTGRPNSGKSTLLNKIIGEKIAITSSTSQTTRRQIKGILTTDKYQLVFVDTPGIHKPKDVLGEELNAAALGAVPDVDIVAMLVDSSKPLGRGDEWVFSHIDNPNIKKIAVLSKTDLVTRDQLDKQILSIDSLGDWDAVVCLSSKNGRNVDAFIEECVHLLPFGPRWFPKDAFSDQTEELLIEETIREKVLRNFRDEVPHSVGVILESLEYDSKKHLYRIDADIYTERESQKAILIGKGGKGIRRIGSEARADLESLLGAKIFLNLAVKVKRNWRSDEAQLKRFGYID